MFPKLRTSLCNVRTYEIGNPSHNSVQRQSPSKPLILGQTVPEGKPLGCTLILSGLLLLIRAFETDENYTVIQGAP